MEQYIIEYDKGLWLSSTNNVKFEYWSDQTTEHVIRYNRLTGFLYINFIRLVFRIQGTPKKIYLKKHKDIMKINQRS